MALSHYSGRVIFTTAVVRDEYLARHRDVVEGVLEVRDYTGPSDYQAGLATQNNVQGSEITGPAFTFSLRVPDSELDVGGHFAALQAELAGRDDAEMTSSSSPVA